MKNSAYWQARFELLQETQLKKGEELISEELERSYREAITGLDKDISYWFKRFANNNETSITEARRLLNSSELEELKWTVEEYIRYGRENAIDPKWIKQLENASAKVHISRLESLKIQMQQHLEVLTQKKLAGTTGLIDDIYKSSFYKTAYEVQRGLNLGWQLDMLDEAKVEQIIKSPWAADGKNFSNRIWEDKAKLMDTLNTEFKQGLIRGDNPDKIIKKITDRLNVSKSNAKRLVMTESAFFTSAGNKASYNELGVEAYDIVATLDRKTSEICQEMDGLVFEMKLYEVGVTAPPFHTYCRTTTAPHFEDEFEAGAKRAARGINGKTEYVPADMKYEEWYNKFIVPTLRPKTLAVSAAAETVRQMGFMDTDGQMKLMPKGVEINSVTIIAGQGTTTEFRAAGYYAETFGGAAEEWSKRAGKAESAEKVFDIHWAEHKEFGIKGMKIKDWKEK